MNMHYCRMEKAGRYLSENEALGLVEACAACWNSGPNCVMSYHNLDDTRQYR